MTTGAQKPATPEPEAFARQAETAQPGPLREMLAYLKHRRKWFLAPIIVLLLLAGIFVLLSGTVAAPFLYTVF